MRVKKIHIVNSIRNAQKRVQAAEHQNKVDIDKIPDFDIVGFMFDSFDKQVQDQKKIDLEKILKSIISK